MQKSIYKTSLILWVLTTVERNQKCLFVVLKCKNVTKKANVKKDVSRVFHTIYKLRKGSGGKKKEAYSSIVQNDKDKGNWTVLKEPVWITTNCGKFFKRWEYQTTWRGSWETCMQVKKHHLELDMGQQTGSI